MTTAGPPTDGSVVGGRVLAQPVLVRATAGMAVVRDLVVYPDGLAIGVETAVPGAAAPRVTATLAGAVRGAAVHLGGDGGPEARIDRYWLAQAPPPGDVALDVEWPAGELPAGGCVVTARQMAEARGRIIG